MAFTLSCMGFTMINWLSLMKVRETRNPNASVKPKYQFSDPDLTGKTTISKKKRIDREEKSYKVSRLIYCKQHFEVH